MKHLLLVIINIFSFSVSTMAQTDTTIGRTPGSFTVSLSGAATYTIPIQIAPAAQGIQPNISLEYNSQAGLDIAGMGWTISGLSSITRAGIDPYRDNQDPDGYIPPINCGGPPSQKRYGTIQFNNTDHFVLDGEILVPISGANGANNTQYATETESFNKIYSYATSSSPSRFEVQTLSGKKREYGTGTSTQILSPRTQPLTWYLSQVTDENGNYMTYNYESFNSGADHVIKSIYYTYNNASSETGSYYILFEYEDYTFPSYYFDGQKFTKGKRLKKIKTYANSVLLREYVLEYKNAKYPDYLDYYTRGTNKHFYLTSITEKNQTGQVLKSTIFEMSEDVFIASDKFIPQDREFILEHSLGIKKQQKLPLYLKSGEEEIKQTLLGDIDGDGLQDLVIVHDVFSSAGTKPFLRSEICTFLNKGDSLVLIGCKTNEFYNYSGIGKNMISGEDQYALELQDLNGDGKADLAGLGKQGVMVALSNGNGFNTAQVWNDKLTYTKNFRLSQKGYTSSYTNPCSQKFPVLFADITGDGLSDLVYIDTLGIYGYPNSSGFSFNCPIERQSSIVFGCNSKSTDGSRASIQFGDFNGDGMEDAVVALNDLRNGKDALGNTIKYSTQLAFSKGEGFETPLKLNQTIGVWNEECQGKVVDINGDGLADVIKVSTYKTGSVSNLVVDIHYGTGKGLSERQSIVVNCNDLFCNSWSFPANKYFENNENYSLVDLNADGLLDIVIYESTYVMGFLNQGNGFSLPFLIGKEQNLHLQQMDICTWGKFGNSNLHELLCIKGNDVYFIGNTRGGDKKVLRKIADGMGNQTEISYKYQRGNTASDAAWFVPNVPTFLVDTVIYSNKYVAGKNIEKYSFQYGITADDGHRFLGFRVVTLNDLTNKTVTTQNFRYYRNKKEFCLPLSTTVTDAEGKTNETQYNYAVTTMTKGYHAWTYLNSSTEKTSFGSNRYLYKKNEYTYDKTKGGLCTLNKISYSLGESQAAFRIDSLKTDYINLGINTIKPSFLKTSSIFVQTGEKQVRETQFQYSGSRLYKKIQEPNQPQYKVIEEIIGRDAYGNVTALKITPAEGEQYAKTYSYEYGSKGRFKTKETNPLGHITRYEYDACLGTLLKTTNANNLSTTSEYDKWGNITKQTTPEGNIAQITTKWVTPQMNVTGAAYYTQVTSTVGYPATTYYDALGRAIKNITQTAYTSAAEIHTETQYDTLGRVTAVSYPHAKTASPTWKTYKYDVMNRVIEEKGLHLYNTYTYSPLKTVLTDKLNNASTTAVYNEMGQTTEASDPGGSIQYAYTIEGLPKTIITNGQTINMLYDLLGNKTKIQDPNAGTTTYTYNSLGLLTSTTNAYGKTTQYKYDKLNRVTLEIRGNDTIKSVYDPANCLGALAYKQGLNDKIEYTYDLLGRLLKQNETLRHANPSTSYDQNYNNYQLAYTYNTNGTLKSLQYPNGFLLNYEYNTYGVRTKITNGAYGTIWELKDKYVQGTTKELQMANGKLKFNYGCTEPSPIINSISVQNSNTPIYNRVYVSSSNGSDLMARRYDGLQNNSLTNESFSYDNLQRLTGSTINNNTTNYNYGANGNINEHTGTGNYQYIAQQPNAVSKIGLNANAQVREATCNTTFNQYVNKVQTIEEGEDRVDYAYGVNNQCTKSTTIDILSPYKDFSGTLVKGHKSVKNHIGNLYEDEHCDKMLWYGFPQTDVPQNAYDRNTCYIYADSYTPIAMYRQNTFVNSNGNFGSCAPTTPEGFFYFITDRLGSVEAVTDVNGNVLQRMSYNAWGNRRNPNNWSMKDTNTTPYITNLGFTGHEHLDKFNIINMKGRLYDPAIGRFFSPDPFVQMPNNTQNYNRYSYCLNNPLKYVDPTGYQWYLTMADDGTFIPANCPPVVITADRSPSSAPDLKWDPYIEGDKSEWDLLMEQINGFGQNRGGGGGGGAGGSRNTSPIYYIPVSNKPSANQPNTNNTEKKPTETAKEIDINNQMKDIVGVVNSTLSWAMQEFNAKKLLSFKIGSVASSILGVTLDAPGVFYDYHAMKNGEITELTFKLNTGVVITAQVLTLTLAQPVAPLVGPAVWTFGWAVNTLNQAYVEMNHWGLSLPQKYSY